MPEKGRLARRVDELKDSLESLAPVLDGIRRTNEEMLNGSLQTVPTGGGPVGIFSARGGSAPPPDGLADGADYAESLTAAAVWAGISPPFSAFGWPKPQRDALIAAWEAAGSPGIDGGPQRGASGSGGGGSSGGGGHVRDRIIETGGQAIGGQNFTNGGGLNVAIGGASVAAASRQEGLLRTVADEIRGLRGDLRVDGLSSRTSGA